jgi:hypothetical protein
MDDSLVSHSGGLDGLGYCRVGHGFANYFDEPFLGNQPAGYAQHSEFRHTAASCIFFIFVFLSWDVRPNDWNDDGTSPHSGPRRKPSGNDPDHGALFWIYVLAPVRGDRADMGLCRFRRPLPSRQTDEHPHRAHPSFLKNCGLTPARPQDPISHTSMPNCNRILTLSMACVVP